MPLNYNKILEYNFGNNSGEFENIILIFSVQYPIAFSFVECVMRGYLTEDFRFQEEHMEKKLMRIGISLPGKLLDKFDKSLLKRGYSSRSEGIRDAIRTYN
jgi:hypothetical protein